MLFFAKRFYSFFVFFRRLFILCIDVSDSSCCSEARLFRSLFFLLDILNKNDRDHIECSLLFFDIVFADSYPAE